MDARKYWTMCRLHDWHYTISDDDAVFQAGAESEDQLMHLAWKNPELRDIFHAWREHHYRSGPKPAEPKLED